MSLAAILLHSESTMSARFSQGLELASLSFQGEAGLKLIEKSFLSSAKCHSNERKVSFLYSGRR